MPACAVPCEGASCGDLYPRASLGIFSAAPPTVEIDALAPRSSVDGSDADGFDWAIHGANGGVLVGVPASDELRWFDAAAVASGAGATAVLGGVNAGHRFGAAVSVGAGADGATQLVVGAPAYGAGPMGGGAGAVLVYEGLDASLAGASTPRLVLGIEAEDHFGERVWACGDLDADGRPDWAAAAPWSSSVSHDLAGSLTVGLSSTPLPSGSSSADLPRLVGGSNGAHFGAAVRCETSFDADAIPDLLVSSPYASDGVRSSVGSVAIWTGPVDLVGSPEPTLVVYGPEAGADFGVSLAVGDLDGDGEVDLVVGAPGVDGGEENDAAGAVFVYSAGDLRAALAESAIRSTLVPSWTLRGEFPSGRLGATVHVADLDGDGRGDLIAGSPGLNRTGSAAATRAGAASIWWGPSTAWPSIQLTSDAPTTVVADRQYLETGRTLSTADLDGDGAHELFLLLRTAADAE